MAERNGELVARRFDVLWRKQRILAGRELTEGAAVLARLAILMTLLNGTPLFKVLKVLVIAQAGSFDVGLAASCRSQVAGM